MADEHPDVTVTPVQARRIRWAYPYQQTPELAAKFQRFSEALLTLAASLIQLDYSGEREAALAALQNFSRRLQEVYTLEEGIPGPFPSWFHVVEPPPEEPMP